MPTSEDTLFRLAEIIRRVMNDPGAEINRATQAIDVQGWDSLSHTFLMLEVERHFGIHFPLERMVSLDNVGELADLVASLAPADRKGP